MRFNKRIREIINKQKIKRARRNFELTPRGRYFYEYCLKIANNTYRDSDFNFSYDKELNELVKIFTNSETFNEMTDEQKRRTAAIFYIHIWKPVYQRQFCNDNEN